ncbi:MAG: maleylpyruvate isomerase family mycothiol-dependent enzyme [Micromonosporaceae bacterium]
MSRTHGSKDFWLAALRADGAAFRAAVDQPDVLSLTVPSCPEWSVGELVRHLGGVYRRTHTRLGAGTTDQPWGPTGVPEDAPPAADEAVLAWFERELGQLDSALEAADPDLPAWNWAPQTKTAAFWHRRMAHETAIHRWDVQLATGLPEPIEGKLAGDTVAEAFDTFLPAGRRREAAEVAGLVHLVAADLGHKWYVRLRGGGVALLDTDTLLDDDAHPTRAAASGSASDLALAVWGRIAFDVLDTAGDSALLEALRVA